MEIVVGHDGCIGQTGGVPGALRLAGKKGVLNGGIVGDSGKASFCNGEEPPAGVKYCGEVGSKVSTELVEGSVMILGLV